MRAPIRLFTAIIAAALALTGLTARAVGLDWSAASLSGLGRYPEVNAGTGALVVSGDTAGEVWRIDPATGAYTVYTGLTSVRDARTDAIGNIWVADWSDNALVRIDAGGTATSWPVGAVVLWGVAFDDAGRVWVADDASSRVFRFNPASRQLCTYTLPGGGSAEYMVNRNGVLWLGEYANGRIVRLDPTADTVGAAWWEIGSTSYPEGLAVDASGHVWFADYTQNSLGRLDPGANQLTRYTPPIGTVTAMVALVSDRLWYTEEGLGTVGVLDPTVAAGQTSPVATGSGDLSPSCTPLGAGTSIAVTTRSGTLAFADLTPTPLADAGGWTVYGLPAGSKPWGIAEAASNVWIADHGHQKLLRVSESQPPASRVYLPLVLRH